MSVVVLVPEPTAASRALLAALRAGLGPAVEADSAAATVAACGDTGRPVIVADLRHAGAVAAAETAALRLALPGAPLLALLAPGTAAQPECDAVLTEPFYLVEVVRWCARARLAPLSEGVLADLAAGLSHEIGNPLTALLLQLELLRSDARIVAIREHLDLIEEMSRRIQQVVADVSLASERRPVAALPVRLATVVDEARAQLTGRRADWGRRLNLACDDQPVQAEAPLVASALADTWQYLLLAGSGNEMLSVDAGRHDVASVCVRARARVPRLPDDADSRLFTPLWARQALGLPDGLSLTSARSAFRRHGGELRVREQRGENLVIEALLPSRSPA